MCYFDRLGRIHPNMAELQAAEAGHETAGMKKLPVCSAMLAAGAGKEVAESGVEAAK